MDTRRTYWTTEYRGGGATFTERVYISYRRTAYYGLTPEETIAKVKLLRHRDMGMNAVSVNKNTGAVYSVKKLRKRVVRTNKSGKLLFTRNFIPRFEEIRYEP